jgi:uracil-DNA glycosylase family 4
MGVGRRIKGEGPRDARIMVIGEHPGKAEAKTGRVYSGRGVGDELSRFFNGVRLPDRSDVFLTTWIREWCGEDGEYTAEDWKRDLPELEAEIRLVQPEVIVCLGSHVTRYFLGDVTLEETHGLQWCLPPDSRARALFTDPGRVVVHAGYSLAAGFRNPDFGAAIAYDFAQLEAYLAGELSARILYDDPFPAPEYREITDIDDLDRVMAEGGRISSDTEGYPHAPWSVQGCTRAGTAWCVRYSNRLLIERFVDWVRTVPALYHFVFHNSLHDLEVFRAFGIDTRRITFDDTMIMSYNLQIEPQGLKPLCVRLCGMQMQDFDDVMGDASLRLAQDWLFNALETEEFEHEHRRQEEFIRLTTTPYVDKKGKVKPGRKLRTLPKLPKSKLHQSIERCLRSKDPRKLWGDQIIDRQVEAEARYGRIWEATLDHVPPDTALRYACRDADGTHRVERDLRGRIHAAGLDAVYRADMGTVPLIDRMAQIGIKPDLDHFARLGVDLQTHYTAVLDVIRGISGLPEFNPNSTYQVGDLLFALPIKTPAPTTRFSKLWKRLRGSTAPLES